MNKETLQDIKEFVLEQLDNDAKDLLATEYDYENNEKESEYKDYQDFVFDLIDGVLEYTNIKNETIDQDNDFSDRNSNGSYYSDLATEWADRQIDIYYQDLYRKSWNYKYYIEQSVNEFGIDNRNFSLSQLFQSGQYLFWEEFANEVLRHTETFIKEYTDQ